MKTILKFIKWIFPYALLTFFAVLTYCYTVKIITTQLEIFSSIYNGIISGIVTALILFIVKILWQKNILIWIENLLYQDACIEGEWSGLLVPYMGLDDIDKLQKDIAWRKFKEMINEKRIKPNAKQSESKEMVEASVVNENGEEEKISAEVVIPSNKRKSSGGSDNSERRIAINLTPEPIIVKIELNRVGHQVSARMIEIGGASDTYTYTITGSFKNLILSGCYETISKGNIDRGALSLMLVDNGKKLEGFFSSYSDDTHKVVPMQCVIWKKNHLENIKMAAHNK